MAIGLSTFANHPNYWQFLDVELIKFDVWTSVVIYKSRDDLVFPSSGMTSSPLPVIQMTTCSCPCPEGPLNVRNLARTSCPLPVIQMTKSLDSENVSLSGSRPRDAFDFNNPAAKIVATILSPRRRQLLGRAALSESPVVNIVIEVSQLP